MKTIRLTVLAALALLVITPSVAGEDPARKTPAPEKAVHQYFKFPSLLLPAHSLTSIQTTRVEVLYTTGPEGRVNFVTAGTSDQQLKQEIERQFSQLVLPNLPENVVHKMVLNFRAI